MSGHNKWSQIKHRKGAADAKKSKVFSMLSREITIQSKLAGGDANSSLVKTAVEKARKANMPKDSIERAVKKGAGKDSSSFEKVMYEGYGPGGVAIVATGITDNTNRTSNEVKHIFSKAEFSIGTPGSAIWAFSKTDSAEGTKWIPNMEMEISDADGEKLGSLTDALESHDDIEEVFTNAK